MQSSSSSSSLSSVSTSLSNSMQIWVQRNNRYTIIIIIIIHNFARNESSLEVCACTKMVQTLNAALYLFCWPIYWMCSCTIFQFWFTTLRSMAPLIQRNLPNTSNKAHISPQHKVKWIYTAKQAHLEVAAHECGDEYWNPPNHTIVERLKINILWPYPPPMRRHQIPTKA